MWILKHQHGTYGYNFLDICHVYLDRGLIIGAERLSLYPKATRSLTVPLVSSNFFSRSSMVRFFFSSGV